MKSIVKGVSLEKERGKSSEVKFFGRLKWTWHRPLCVEQILSLKPGEDDFSFEEAVRARGRKLKQVELEGQVLWWNLKAVRGSSEWERKEGRI